MAKGDHKKDRATMETVPSALPSPPSAPPPYALKGPDPRLFLFFVDFGACSATDLADCGIHEDAKNTDAKT